MGMGNTFNSVQWKVNYNAIYFRIPKEDRRFVSQGFRVKCLPLHFGFLEMSSLESTTQSLIWEERGSVLLELNDADLEFYIKT